LRREKLLAKLTCILQVSRLSSSRWFDPRRNPAKRKSHEVQGEIIMSYVDGFVIPVRAGGKEAYRAIASKAAPIFKEHGATHVVECWGDDLPEGKVTDFKRAVKAEAGENVVFSWIVWPSKQTRDEGNKKVMEDPRMQMGDDMPFDMQRMFMGGFEVLVDTKG
jgi:uncharacterized protein YbaA (DUF1428 family)